MIIKHRRPTHTTIFNVSMALEWMRLIMERNASGPTFTSLVHVNSTAHQTRGRVHSKVAHVTNVRMTALAPGSPAHVKRGCHSRLVLMKKLLNPWHHSSQSCTPGESWSTRCMLSKKSIQRATTCSESDVRDLAPRMNSPSLSNKETSTAQFCA